jgi:hypothetical protein
VSLALLALLAWQLDRQTIGAHLQRIEWGWLLAAAALGPLQIVVGGLRWAAVSEGLAVPLRRDDAVTEYGLSTALNQLLPGGIAGDVVRVWRQRHHGARDVLVAAVVDRAVGLGVLLVVAWTVLVVYTVATGGPWSAVAVVGAAGLGLGGLLASRWGRPGRRALQQAPGTLLGSSLLLVASFVVGFALASRAVGVPVTGGLLAMVPLVLLAMAVPGSFAGWGPREVAAAWLWPLVGATAEQGVAVSATYGLSVLLGSLPGLLGAVRRPPG